ncbi:fimbria/pilus periplasmic chaperone [Pantoea anthophila]|uniref:fimbrial biogenesis chaperone n=1 Tax=Pantoea anthophila TaxID=470931 RepID=UPI002DB852C9|nr:fimbria/pilus periplasmic chaperone [Pantoea anthophila]MEB7540291.1 fimbria/pilus periplasmic chaperone [Pantoea anthophila]
MSRLLRAHSSLRTLLLLSLLLMLYQSAFASVVMTGSRIIYPADRKSVDLQLRNNDGFPYVVQAWFDNGDEQSTPATGKAPFVVTPPTFRIPANEGQVLRIFFVGDKSLPQDRESAFYFNFLQIPPGNVSGDEGNQMTVLLKNRIKLFYRPSALRADPRKISDYLTFSNVSSSSVRIANASPYYVSLSKVAVKNAVAKDTPPMIAPFASVDVPLTERKVRQSVQGIKIGLVNDYGATVTYEYPINK